MLDIALHMQGCGDLKVTRWSYAIESLDRTKQTVV